ncbi:hypothetical protein SAMN05660420_01772 [Desulfuromusa kysingii]|uniref:Radical SAM core domain-containing protein n=1 Tax=Desulfuromusa kysingii TaxID=37625 RepID=A0A1H4A3C1_9BACT|nr:radical SAM protein [Desulfuromusa kysingii]SEA30131.1 hypothetical protein SAMN05660420_01772 [Desulfuromusa kysingii]
MMTHPEHTSIIGRTLSLCSFCMKQIEAQIIVNDNAVYMRKNCAEHGSQMIYLWPDADHYRWMRDFRLNHKEMAVHTLADSACPHNCGPCDRHMGSATLIELEVTQRCNMRCPVCFMSAENIGEDPTLDELSAIFHKIFARSGGSTSIQITGGEPTVRHDLAEIVRLGRRIGFKSIEVNTNGLVISRNPELLKDLKDAGVSGIYMQFDGLDDRIYQATRGQNIHADKLQAIANCRAVGLPVVLAMTIIEGVNDDQIGKVVDFALNNIDVVTGVALQPAFSSGRFDVETPRGLTMGDVIFKLNDQTDGLIGIHDMWPLGCSHPLCSCGTQLIWDRNHFVPATKLISRDEYEQSFDPSSPQGSIFADILAKRNETYAAGLSLIIMSYMDANTIDLGRLKECSMVVATDEGRLIPFCAYQLSNRAGERLYQPWIFKEKQFAAKC